MRTDRACDDNFTVYKDLKEKGRHLSADGVVRVNFRSKNTFVCSRNVVAWSSPIIRLVPRACAVDASLLFEPAIISEYYELL
jgi:hypothetical protein